MYRIAIILVALKIVYSVVTGENVQDIASLPYCPDQNESGLVLVSTLDGRLSAVNSTGHLKWQIETGPGPLLVSNIHNLELTNNGEWIRIIPSLTGTLYKFDGFTIDPIPISAESLLKSSFRYSDDLVIAGGIEVRTYGIGFRSGKLFYECTPVKCSNDVEQDFEDVMLVERSTQTIRAVEPRTGNERWNFSVGLHNIKLPRMSCIDSNPKLFDWNLTAVLPEGLLRASKTSNSIENSWQYKFTAPIVRVWRWNGMKLTEINLFAPKNIPNIVMPSSTFLPAVYIGMHKKQLYIHESVTMQNTLQGKPNTDLVVAESHSIAKIPWKPIPASTEITDDDSTALSVLNASEYVNGNGYYLYTEADLKEKNSELCDKNHSLSHHQTIPMEEDMLDEVYTYSFRYFKELILMIFTIVVCNVLFRIWNSHYQPNQEIIIVEKPVEAQVTTQERKVSERENEFTSRYMNDFDTIQCLGKGGFGVVFEVKQKIDECYYAIKRITLPNEAKSRDRVMREVKALAKLDHQNIVRYFCSWVESPPIGWEQDHDQKWIEDKSYMLSGNTTATARTTTEGHSKVRRSKSASVSIDIPLQKFDQEALDFEDGNSSNDDDDDSFIVFEKSNNETVTQKDQDDSFIVFERPSQSLSQHISFGEDTVKTLDCTVSSGIEVTNSKSVSDHFKKKIDWRRPGRRHHSWDTSQNNLITLKPKDPPVYLYIQMQLCQKESLKEWLSSNKNREYDMVKDIFLQILNAVEYVHLRGLIHRDLKPSNIFFSLEGQIKVGDFGLVKDMEDALDLELIQKNNPSVSYRGHTREVGTQLYMSPEQFESRLYDYKVDIYALGLIFFELLVPFSTDMERIKTLTDLKKNKYPEDFREKYLSEYKLLQNMLCEDPNKRLTTIGIRSRPPFNISDPEFYENHYRLTNFKKN